ncbi:MAG TPA: nucleotide exchange factor GrpE [candidate division Zixibacteria bacterium]|nr:nucleotide exchange factor GrpE [candidate division Zixibacteria bacterium]
MTEDPKKPNETAEIDNQERSSGESAAEPQNASPPSPEVETENLRQQLAAAENQARENYDRFLRAVAELENFKKRAARDKEEAVRFANEDLIRDLLPIVDNLERAVAHAKGGGNGKPIVEGVEMILRALMDVLAKHEAVPIAAVGEPFDPEKHEAMAQVESETVAPNTVTEEHHKGYLFRGRLLRPALVTVAKAPERKAQKDGDSEVEKTPTDD